MDDSKVRARVFDVIRRFLDVDDAPKSTNKDARRDWLAPPPKASFQGIDPIFLYGTDEDWFFNPHDCKPPANFETFSFNSLKVIFCFVSVTGES